MRLLNYSIWIYSLVTGAVIRLALNLIVSWQYMAIYNQEVAVASLICIGVSVDYGCLQTQTWPIAKPDSCLTAMVGTQDLPYSVLT